MLFATLWQLPFMAIVGWSDWQELLPNAIRFSIIWQTWLLCLRAIISCSVSVGEEVEKKTVVILHTTPLGLGRLLLTKLAVCLWPLLVEIYFIAVFYQLLNLVHPWSDWLSLLKLQLLQASATLLYGCFGLWLGGLIGAGERAAASARATAFMTMVGCLLLEKALTWPLLLAGGMIWFFLILQPHSRPSRAYQSGVIALVLLLILPALYHGVASYLPTFELSQYSPLFASYYNESAPGSSLIYLGLSACFGYLGYRQILKAV